MVKVMEGTVPSSGAWEEDVLPDPIDDAKRCQEEALPGPIDDAKLCQMYLDRPREVMALP
ncbi:hypothetical protein T484DRAFT_1801810 [Baffinella frigidus]|nr:hypothetical protein T484DRAFT_1801810 [Cryptophyta sp. CCMP2293]